MYFLKALLKGGIAKNRAARMFAHYAAIDPTGADSATDGALAPAATDDEQDIPLREDAFEFGSYAFQSPDDAPERLNC